ncbi:MAG: hypothetical protein WBD67_14065 [Terracidiphilus sp.]
MKRFSHVHEVRLLGLVTLLGAAITWTGCHHASTAAANGSSGATSAASAEGNNPANLPPVGTASQAGTAANTASSGNGNAQAASAKPPTVALTVTSGTEIPVRIDHRLDTRTARDGETFSGELYAPVQARNGAIVFPRGTPVTGEVVASKSKGRFRGAGILGIQLEEIGNDAVTTDEYAVSAKGKGKRSAAFIGGGAGGGAVIGALAGGGTGALIGALAGGGAGTAGAAFTGRRDVVIPAETRVRFRLRAPLTTAIRQ